MEYCPMCQKYVNTLRTVKEQKQKRGNKIVRVTWTSYQCRSCLRTIRGEKSERNADKPASVE